MSEVKISLNSKTIPLKIQTGKLLVLDQTKLPLETVWVTCDDAKSVANSIKVMHVRGAPAIGVAAAYGFYLEINKQVSMGKKLTHKKLESIKAILDKSRPTAVNLFWATEKMLQYCSSHLHLASENPQQLVKLTFNQAKEIHLDDAQRCLNIGLNGLEYFNKNFKNKKKLRILTHCNAGSLATGGIGTAIGIIRVLHQHNKIEHVYADETRPYLQGSRLTAYELHKEKIPFSMQVDSMAAVLMQRKLIDAVIVGSDRISKNHDVANKIGTYALSVLAKAHNIPLIVAAPESTFDLTLKSGSMIPIEQRSSTEVTQVQGTNITTKNFPVLNESFDVTPAKNVSAIITENEIIKP